MIVVGSEKFHNCFELLLCHILGVAEDDSAGVLYLVVIELAEVLHVYFCLLGVNYGSESVELKFRVVEAFNCFHDIAELAYSGRFDKDPVGMELLKYLLKRIAEIAYKAAADASCVHFIDLDAGILEETAVNADLSELVLDENNLLSLIRFFHKFFDERGLACSEETAENINFCHF